MTLDKANEIASLLLFILFLTFIAICLIGIIFFKPVCDTYKITEFIQAVGHRSSTSYIYRNDRGEVFTDSVLYQVGDEVCVTVILIRK